MTAFADFQRRLQALGADPGPADGKAGLMTASAFAKDLKSRYGQTFEVVPNGGLLTARGPISVAAPDPEPPPPGVTVPGIYQGSARYPVTEIVVHCPATRPDWMAGQPFAARVAEIRRWHVQDRKWKDLGYHHLIDRDGKVLPGRPETVIGAGVEGHNRGVLHLCIMGGFDSAATDEFSRNYTFEQDVALRSLIASIKARTRIKRVSGHNEWAAKACPGFFVPSWLKGPDHVR